jgi:cell division protein FtsI (penicillin-binding protein 3)
MKAADVRRSARRVEIALGLFVLVFAVLSLRAAHLSVFDQRGALRGDNQSQRVLTLPPTRGEIVDRSGAALVLSVDAPSIYVEPSRVAEVQAAARALGRILGLDAGALAGRLRERRGFQFVARWVEPEQAERVLALDLDGVGVVQEPRRVYPHHRLAARVLGFSNIDGQGVRGIEQQEDSWLRGTTRRLAAERDGSGRLLIDERGATRGTAGGDLKLTLDATLQADSERALADAVRASGARGGVVIAMDPHSGDILSLAESPSFDPNHFRELDYASTRSGAFLDAIEPGSAFKAYLIAAALEKHAIRPDERIDCGDGTLRVPGKTIRDKKPRGILDPAGILRLSSNIGAVHVAYALGPGDHWEMLRRFGFGEVTESGFPDESAGVLRPWRDWRPVDHATIAFGQGVSVTPIQLAAATAALANGGEWLRPRLVAARRAPGGAWQPTERPAGRRVVGPETAARVLRMLETVVGEDGTGALAALPGVRVAGKTGTAQKFDTREGRYSQQRFRAWFVGVAPADAPRIVIVAGLDEPRRPHHTGGASAAPLFAVVARSQLARQGIHVDSTPVQIAGAGARRDAEDPAADDLPAVAAPPPARRPAPTPAARPVSTVAPVATRVTSPASARRPPQPAPTPASDALEVASFRGRVLLPDFRGLSLEEVTRITAGQGLQVKVQGRGRAVAQEPPPGTILQEGAVVHIEFRGAQAAEPRRGGPRSG